MAPSLNNDWVKGLFFTAIGADSHAAILARALGIAMFIDTAGQRTQQWQDGEPVRLRMDSGDIALARIEP
ncbi:PEP-utilizing enzyme [Erwinia sp. V71]|uniref:PEP-utilizing enzyme n=1 Tax=Erwinia sp. V71 TaxID=3369424 RepID=UPI003F63C7A2